MPQIKLSQAIKQSNQITLMLDQVLGSDRFDRGPVDIANLALEYSAHTAPESPIREVLDLDIPGCMGALVYGESKPRQWTIVSHIGQSDGRKAYTLGHEFGHYVLHRKLIDEDERFDGGIWCDESSVLRREGVDIEQEADEFAANLLMPFHDFRRQISAKTVPSFDDLGTIAERYGVSLTAATLRWLEYTETRALLVVSNEGYAHWAKTSKAALKTGHFIKTRNTMYELPASASAVTKDFRKETVDGISQPAGVWFDEPVVEMCISSKRYEQEMTLLHLPRKEPVHHADEIDEDAFDKLSDACRR